MKIWPKVRFVGGGYLKNPPHNRRSCKYILIWEVEGSFDNKPIYLKSIEKYLARLWTCLARAKLESDACAWKMIETIQKNQVLEAEIARLMKAGQAQTKLYENCLESTNQRFHKIRELEAENHRLVAELNKLRQEIET